MNNFSKYSRFLEVIILFGLFVFLITIIWSSLSWPIIHDVPILHYGAMLMSEYDMLPYKDFKETSLPGTFLLHYAIGELFGFGDFPLILLHTFILVVISAGVYRFVSPVSKLSAIWAVLIFAILSYFEGPSGLMQRDYIGLFPLALCFFVMPSSETSKVTYFHFLLIGFFVGLSFWIKPHLGLALPILFAILLTHLVQITKKSVITEFFMRGVVTAVGFLMPAIFFIYWLVSNDLYNDFLEVTKNIVIPYSELLGNHESVTQAKRLFYILFNLFYSKEILPLISLLVISAIIVSASRINSKFCKTRIIFIYIFAVVFFFYPHIAAKYWGYHYIPLFLYFALAVSICRFKNPGSYLMKQPAVNLCIVLFLTWFVLIQAKVDYLLQIVVTKQFGSHLEKRLDVAKIVEMYMKENLAKNQTVLPLDLNGGGIFGLLNAKAKLGGDSLVDFHHYHNVSSEGAINRKNFMDSINAAPPDFVVQVSDKLRNYPSGIDASVEFPELESFIKENYIADELHEDLVIYKKIERD